MKKIVSILGAAALLSIAGFSNAGVITDTVEQNVYVGWWDSHTYSHDITDDGFNLGSAVSGTLSIAVSDDRDSWYEFGGESILFVVEAFDFDTGSFSFGSGFFGDLEVNALAALNDDGMLEVTVASLWGDFYVGDSVLTVDVPAPSTLVLMSLGLLGLGAVRKVGVK